MSISKLFLVIFGLFLLVTISFGFGVWVGQRTDKAPIIIEQHRSG